MLASAAATDGREGGILRGEAAHVDVVGHVPVEGELRLLEADAGHGTALVNLDDNPRRQTEGGVCTPSASFAR